MIVCERVREVRSFVDRAKSQGKSIGFVPTMGALHAGHLSLIHQAKAQNDLTVCSIFVNPAQFDQLHDFEHYPKLPKEDQALLLGAGCDVLFAPHTAEMYPHGIDQLATKFSFGQLEYRMEGRHRPGHFNGVGIVVSKLFHIVNPDRAYFGQKDLQQYLIIRQLVEDLSFDLEVIRCPIVREADGLAMSSRNLRLSPEERAIAPLLHQTLQQVADALFSGVALPEALEQGRGAFAQQPAFQLEYLEAGDARTLAPVEVFGEGDAIAICLAAQLGSVRLIDNIIIE